MKSKKTYAEKLKSPAWQKRRLQILERDNWQCYYCKDGETELHVHHLRYKKNSEPHKSPNCDLITACKCCHAIITFLEKECRQKPAAIYKFKEDILPGIFQYTVLDYKKVANIMWYHIDTGVVEYRAEVALEIIEWAHDIIFPKKHKPHPSICHVDL